MNAVQLSLTIIGASLLSLSIASSSPAQADGMPFKEAKPQPILTPLDQALNEIQNKAPAGTTPPREEQKPVPVTQPAPAPEPAPAVPQSRVVEVQPNSSFFGLSVGMYDPFTHDSGVKAASLNMEWQPGVKIAGVLQPLFGALVTTRGSMMGYGGIGVPFHAAEHVYVMPSIAVGAYKEGDGYDLGRTLAVRLGTEIAYEFSDKSRIGLNAHILSNGTSMGRSDRTEILGLVYTTPMDAFSGSAKETPKAQAPAPGKTR